jgi:hypothetical protein
MAVCLGGAIPPAAAVDLESGMADFVAGLPTETEECDFLRSLCRAAWLSGERAEGTPPSADFLATRQGLMAETRIREAVAAADAIEHKRGRRLPCFTEDDCKGVLPRPRARPAR